MNSGIYEIVSSVTGNRYVGSAVDFEKRWKLHRFHLRHGTHHSPHLQASWSRDGAEAFVFRRLLICARSNLRMYEQIAMDALQPRFNVAKFAGSCAGVPQSAETRAKQSAAKVGNTHTRGKKVHTDESRARIAAALRGNTHTKGRSRNPDAVAATAAGHRGLKRSEETRARISAAARAIAADPARRAQQLAKRRATLALKRESQ